MGEGSKHRVPEDKRAEVKKMVYGRVEIISKASLPVSQEKKNGWWQRYTCVIALGKTETRTSRESEPKTRWGFSRLCFRKGR